MKIFCLIIIVSFSQCIISQNKDLFERWDQVDTLIRNRMIDKNDAIDSISIFVPLVIDFCKRNNVIFTKRNDWLFPMSGCTITSYRDNGKDYYDESFDYFQGAEFHGHPAHDIFILDKDSNSLEDSTGKHVNAIAMISGVIISIYDKWKLGDIMRSGNYIKLFDPESRAIFYYSHLDSVFVKPGDIIKSGEVIGCVGRTGRKAAFGKTHLHIAYYEITNGYPEPENIIEDLYKAEKKYYLNKK